MSWGIEMINKKEALEAIKCFDARIDGSVVAIRINLAMGEFKGKISDRYFNIWYEYKKPKRHNKAKKR